MIIDNFDLIKKQLVFPKDGDSFYFVQILQRKKDNPDIIVKGLGSNNNSRLIKAYYITSIESLDALKDEIVALSKVFNARACINLNPRSFEKAGYALLRKIADQMTNRDFSSIRKAYNSICGEYHKEMDKRWIVDIDTKDEYVLANTRGLIYNCGGVVYETLPTKAGYHFITSSFRMDKFKDVAPELDVHKNNPTILYFEYREG